MIFENFESFTVDLVVESPQGILESYRLTMPAFVLKQHFMDAVNKSANRTDALKITMKRIIPTWSQYDQKMFSREAFVRFMNNAYLAWMDEQKNKNGE